MAEAQDITIKKIEADLRSLSGNVDRLCSSNGELIQEMRKMTEILTTHMVDNREHAVKIEHLSIDQTLLFKRLRRLEDKQCPRAKVAINSLENKLNSMEVVIKPLPGKLEIIEGFQGKFKGMLFIIPIGCMLITAIVAIVSIVRHPW